MIIERLRKISAPSFRTGIKKPIYFKPPTPYAQPEPNNKPANRFSASATENHTSTGHLNKLFTDNHQQ